MTGYRLGDRLALQRELSGLTQQQVAERAGLALSYYRLLEVGKRDQPSLAKCRALADVFGCSLDYLAGRCDNPRGAA